MSITMENHETVPTHKGKGIASFVIGVDTGLIHLAAALGVPLVAIFVASEPGLTGPMGAGPIVVVGGKRQQPSVFRDHEAIPPSDIHLSQSDRQQGQKLEDEGLILARRYLEQWVPRPED